MRSVKWLLVGQAVLLYALVYTKARSDCGEKYTNIDITSVCSKSSCVGECRNDGTCCLEHCFEGSIYDMVQASAASCERIMAPQSVSCSYFENITRCAANYLNKDFEVCWKQVLYELTQIEGEISEFNPLRCPCEGLYAPHVSGKCDYLQCRNTTHCETVQDTVRDIDVCCIHQDILPQHSDCEIDEKLDMSVHDHHNISTIVQCQALCEEGVCRMPDQSRLPACCGGQPIKRDVIKADDGLHGGAIAAIVIVIILFVIVGGLVLLYACRTKIHGNIRQRMRQDREDVNCELSDVLKAAHKDHSRDIFDSFQVASCRSGNRKTFEQQEQKHHEEQHEQLQQQQQPDQEQQRQQGQLQQLHEQQGQLQQLHEQQGELQKRHEQQGQLQQLQEQQQECQGQPHQQSQLQEQQQECQGQPHQQSQLQEQQKEQQGQSHQQPLHRQQQLSPQEEQQHQQQTQQLMQQGQLQQQPLHQHLSQAGEQEQHQQQHQQHLEPQNDTEHISMYSLNVTLDTADHADPSFNNIIQ